MRTLLLILLSVTGVFGQSEPASYPVTAKDPKNARDYPGGRGEHQLIIYTPAYGRRSTGTNQWGVEATVRNDVVIAFGGNDSPLRPGEYVLSGHGRARQFLLNTIRIGAKITADDSSVTVRFDAESFRIYTAMRLAELRKKFTALSRQFPDDQRSALTASLGAFGQFLKDSAMAGSGPVDSSVYAAGMALMDGLEYRISLSPAVEGRGVWHRPAERSGEEIERLVRTYAEAGFNMMFVETIWRGETIYPGFITRQKQQFAGFDPLRAYIDAGKRYGVEIHAWIHTFFVGYVGAADDSGTGPILSRHPDWAIVKRNGESVSRAEAGYLYVNPGHPDVQDLIASLYREVRTLYPDIAGMQLDYIRYPVGVPLEESSDYSPRSREAFKAVSGTDPMDIDPISSPEKWEEWRRWRQQVVTDFVKRIRWENPETLLSADIFPDIEEAHRTKMQRWDEWANKGYVNVLAPMAYTVNADWVAESILRMRSVVGESFPLYVGLAPYLKLTPSMLLQQIERCRELKADGIILFATSSLSEQQLRLLAVGPFRTRAVPPRLLQRTTKP